MDEKGERTNYGNNLQEEAYLTCLLASLALIRTGLLQVHEEGFLLLEDATKD